MITANRRKVRFVVENLETRNLLSGFGGTAANAAASIGKLNPQPLPPIAEVSRINSAHLSVSLNPQPLPPIAPMVHAASVQLNPQPLPPIAPTAELNTFNDADGLNPQPLPPIR